MPTVPHTFSPGTLAESAKVNANFDVFEQVLGLTGGTLTGTLNVQSVIPTTADVYTLGSAALSFKDLFVSDSIKLGDTNLSHFMSVVVGSNLTDNRTLTLTTGDANRTITLSGNPTLNDWFDQSVKVAATPTFGQLTIASASPQIIFDQSGVAEGYRYFSFVADESIFDLRNYNDALSSYTVPIQVSKATNAVTLVGTLTVGEAITVPSLNSPGTLFFNNGNMSLTAGGALHAGGAITAGSTLTVQAGGAVISGNTATSSGFFESGRGTKLGGTQTRSFSAGNFTGNGSLSWTIGSVSEWFTLVGSTMFYSHTSTGSTISGTGTQLIISIPLGITASVAAAVPVTLIAGGSQFTGALAQVSGTSIIISYPLGNNHATGTGDCGVWFQMAIPF